MSDDLEMAGSEIAIPGDADLEDELAAERALWKYMLYGVLIAAPICMIIWMAMVAIAVGGDDPQWGAWLGIGAIVGVLAGAFFGGWAAFLAKAHTLDELDSRSARH